MKKISLRFGLVGAILLCWLLPILIIVTLAGVLLNNNYRKATEQEIRAEAVNALDQVEMRLEDSIWDSKAVSYSGIIRNAYRSYLEDANPAQLYRRTNDYLTQNFSRASEYRAAFIRYWGDADHASAYVLCRGTTGHGLLVQCQQDAEKIMVDMQNVDTGMRFYRLDGRFYLVRNLLDTGFKPYATVGILLEPDVIFGSVDVINRAARLTLQVDDCMFVFADAAAGSRETEICYTADVEGHNVVFSAIPAEYNIWQDTPWLRWAVVCVALLVFPLLLIVIWLFHRHISAPMETLAAAYAQIQAGQRGFQIAAKAPNIEFQKQYAIFNDMSAELKNQFERSYQEQRATQKAQIKALQSQINPHFLNNTLEIINWEARLADNDRVCAMIEALSTMLQATLDRDGRTQIPLAEELGYVDAYLYIIRERLGDGFTVEREIEPGIEQLLIPRLILQPIVENAVEHDITANRGGRLVLRARRTADSILLEVEHDGTMTEKDRENIRLLASDQDPGKGRVGLRNVFRRLKLLYGDAGALTIEEVRSGIILARLRLPSNVPEA